MKGIDCRLGNDRNESPLNSIVVHLLKWDQSRHKNGGRSAGDLEEGRRELDCSPPYFLFLVVHALTRGHLPCDFRNEFHPFRQPMIQKRRGIEVHVEN